MEWLERILYRKPGLKPKLSPLAGKELSQLVREALRNLGSIEDLASSPLASITAIGEYPGEELKQRLEKSLRELQNSDKYLSTLVKASMQQPGLSRKELASHFNLCERTFYRRLNLAYYKLGQLLIEDQ